MKNTPNVFLQIFNQNKVWDMFDKSEGILSWLDK